VTGTRRQHPEAGRGQQYIGSKGRRQQEKIYGIIKRIKEKKNKTSCRRCCCCWMLVGPSYECRGIRCRERLMRGGVMEKGVEMGGKRRGRMEFFFFPLTLVVVVFLLPENDSRIFRTSPPLPHPPRI
jgi:hypothetical protein